MTSMYEYKLVDQSFILLRVTVPLETRFNGDVAKLSEKMKEIMIENEGIGLAANQIGFPVRMFVMKHQGEVITCVNPSISQLDNPSTLEEGCLTFPGLVLKIRRANSITASYLTIEGEPVTTTFEGIEARCFQHELDHLDGITFDNRVSRLVLHMAKRKCQKQRGK